jgi:hypothetical protein
MAKRKYVLCFVAVAFALLAGTSYGPPGPQTASLPSHI